MTAVPEAIDALYAVLSRELRPAQVIVTGTPSTRPNRSWSVPPTVSTPVLGAKPWKSEPS